ncbi:UNVERIFIED_CONTAM: hypothetical protein Slati_0014600 [Sesamum latifolium]|uniref:Uncharacterized protein n=1 Tax=Sesamum latifolium TaxID=2727402 RepID=A0AAW2Y668_9LAMI
MDEPSTNMSRLDLARICVEIDFTAPKVQAVHIQINGKTYRQQVVYENCPPYCTFCNHLGHDMSACITKHHTGTSHTDKEPRPPGNSSPPNEDPRDLREIINNRMKGKAVAIDDIHVTRPVVPNVVKDAPAAITTSSNVNDFIANEVSYPRLHVPITEPSVEPTRPGHVEEATPDDFNYEDSVIAELLDKDWDAKNKKQNAPHFTNIEAVEDMNKVSKQDTCPSVVPNSLSEENSPKAAGTTRNFFRGETSRQRCAGDHSPETHLAPMDSEGEEELTPVSNRFQSLEDMKTDDIPQLIESTQNTTSPAKDKETGGSNVDARTHCTSKNTFSTEYPTQEGDASQQEIIFTDSTASNKHKRSKSLEEITNKSPKLGGKGKQVKELTRLSTQDVPWMVGGDFDIILHPNEYQGRDLSRMCPMDDFNDMVSDAGLIDAGFEGEPFTWTNKRIWKRLDRVLYSKEWAEILNNTRVIHLPRRLSDHHPLFIHAAKMENKKPSSFKFHNMWLKHDNFLDTVKRSWCSPIEGYGMYKLQHKLYRTKELLKQWNMDTFGNVFTAVQQAK